jgi:NAD(P)-dependent dehydrogenase (short-subunit alcohol dehydrogenase family)
MPGTKSSCVALGAATLGAALIGRAFIRASRKYDFTNKVVLITGGTRGLGLVLARQFANEGAALAICCRHEDELQRARQELCACRVPVYGETCDVTDEQESQRFVRNVVAAFGRIDVLVNNAGTVMMGPMETMTREDFDEAMKTHFYAPLDMTLAALPAIRARGGGRIINISSIGGIVPAPHLLPYTASKFALTGFSLGLREELLKDNIYVTTIFPGLIRTGSPRNAIFKGKHRLEYAWFKAGDSLPLVSQSAESAARRIIRASRYGEAALITSFPAWLAAKLFVMFPESMTDLYAWGGRVLPNPGGIGPQRARGYESETAFTRSPLFALTNRAAVRNNEVSPKL